MVNFSANKILLIKLFYSTSLGYHGLLLISFFDAFDK